MSPEKISGNGDCTKYHHGDLRNALIAAAAELIEESGSEDFAMIEAARRAGVSSAAPYRHFKDKDDLLWAVGELGFYGMACQLQAVEDLHEPGTVECIIALGKAYIEFVIKRPAFFDLMWGERSFIARHTEEAEEPAARANGFQMLVDQVQAWCERENLNETDPKDLSLKLWSMSTGLSHLTINNHLRRFVPDADPYQLLESTTYSFLEGVKEIQR